MYNYEEQKKSIFTAQGQRLLDSFRKRIKELNRSGSSCFTAFDLMKAHAGDSWDMLACIDMLVELGEITEIEQQGYVKGQDRVFKTL